MRKDDTLGPPTTQEWEDTAEQVARRAKQDYKNARGLPISRGFPITQSPFVILFLLFCIAFALTALFLPQFFDQVFVQPRIESQRPFLTWLNAHPAARLVYDVFVIGAIAVGIGLRIWFTYSRRPSAEEIQRLTLK